MFLLLIWKIDFELQIIHIDHSCNGNLNVTLPVQLP